MPQTASPELDIFLTFYTDVLPDALEEDSLNSSHPLSIPQGMAGWAEGGAWAGSPQPFQPQACKGCGGAPDK